MLGDSEHGDNKENRVWRAIGLTRIGLHCVGLGFAAPEGGAIDVHCPLYSDHAAVWSRLPFWTDVLTLRPALGMTPLELPNLAGLPPPGSGDAESAALVAGDAPECAVGVVGEAEPALADE